jgi:hypothetical protein
VLASLRKRSVDHRANLALLLGALSVVPLLVWWLGWFPGFLSSDSIDQLGQADRFEFSNFHPATHTITLWAITRIWDDPGAVTLVQAIAMAGLLAVAARRLVQLGVHIALAVGAVWLAAVLPMVGATTITIWKDVPYTLGLLWAFTELLLMARDRPAFWNGLWGPLRLGAALGLLMVYRHNGWITVAFVTLALAIGFFRSWRGLLRYLLALIVVGIALPAIVVRTFPVDTTTIEMAEVFTSDVAAVYQHHPESFGEPDLALLEAVAPLDVWRNRYSCLDSTALVFDAAFSNDAIRAEPDDYRALVMRRVLADLPTVIGHRWCAASYLLVPAQPADGFFHRPPFDIPPNTLGIAREPVSDRAFSVTKSLYVWVEPAGRLWLTWRPALVIWLGILTYVGIALRRRLRPILWAAVLIAAQMLNVAATSPAQEFRFAFGIYLLMWLSVPLAWLVFRPSEATLGSPVVDDRAQDDGGAGSSSGGEFLSDDAEELGETGAP